MNLETCNPLAPYHWDDAFIKIIDLVAKKSADLTIGEGIIVNSHEKALQDFMDALVDRTQLSTKLYKFAYINSKIGRAHMWLVRNSKNEFDFVVGEMLSSIRVSIYNEIEVAAEIFTSKNQGDKGWYYHIRFYSDRVEIDSFVDDNTAQVGTIISEVPKGALWVKKEVFKSDIGIVPIIETTNLPKPKFFINNTFTFFPDWEPVAKLINDQQEIVKQKRKERRKNQTWFNGVLTPELLKAVVDTNDGDLVSALKDGLIQNNINGYTKGQNVGFNITYGNPPMDQYNADWLFNEIQIFNGCGYNHPRESEFQSYTNKAQTMMNAVLDEQTTRVKQQYYKTKFYRLFDFIIISEGFWDGNGERPYDIDFKSIGLSDILQKDTLVNSRLANGTMSRVQAIQEYEGTNEFNAKKELELIDKENAETGMEQTYYGWKKTGDNDESKNNENADIVKDAGGELI